MVEVKSSPELDERARESVRAVREGDDQWFADHTADGGDILFFGTAPGEEWRGREAVLSLTVAQIRASMDDAGLSESDDPQFECFEAGDTGWVIAHNHFKLADGSVIPGRSITVLVRDGGTWKRVFGAAQVLVENELLTPGSPLAAQPS